jgi:DNA polymerase elongation subunit (family B)
MFSEDQAPLEFQIKDIVTRDVYRVDEPDEEERAFEGHGEGHGEGREERDRFKNRYYQMTLFGTQEDGKSVALTVQNYRPFFYVRIPDALAKNADAKRAFLAWVTTHIPESVGAQTSLTYEEHGVLFDYNGGKKGCFLRIQMPSQALMRHLKEKFLNKSSTPIFYPITTLFGRAAASSFADAAEATKANVQGTKIGLKVYEANMDPMLRFCHIQNISPAGWVTVKEWEPDHSLDARVAVSAVTDFKQVLPSVKQRTAPFKVASWDIECMSSHGDFPLAVKTYRKPLRELYERGLPDTIQEVCAIVAEAIHAKSSVCSPLFLKKPLNWIPTEAGRGHWTPYTQEYLFDCLVYKGLVEKAQAALRALKTGTDTVATNLFTGKRDGAESKVKGGDDTRLLSLDMLLTSVWPQVKGDEVIQIGTVLYCRGVALSKHVWVLGTVEADAVKPPGASVPIHAASFPTEAQMLRSWFSWMGQTDPDLLIGYNTFNFDCRYLWQRLEECVGVKESLRVAAPLSCLKSRPARLEEKFLSSSAMGDNTMHFISSPGRLQIDLLPYIRRNHNLESYSLDNVSATFVSGAVKDLAQITDAQARFQTKSTKGMVVGRYVTLMDDENDRILDRALVVAVEDKAITIAATAAELAEHGAKPTRWAQVKDDISPKQIFEYHSKGTAADRASIARYCLQDCDLVMELFNKLEILNNAFAMANVCSVPVAFIFLRGQGIKIESLIFKECRKADQLIEVLYSAPRLQDKDKDRGKDSKEEEPDVVEEEDDTYEGAIVLDPKTGVYMDPVSADDFSSLYPSSIISENISHDTLINVKIYDKHGVYVGIEKGSEEFDNLPGAVYVDIEFDILRIKPGDRRKHPEKFPDGKKVVRFVQSRDSVFVPGTIPQILQMLLSKRKETRKLAETEPDEFQKALLDALQLAYKLTANSLYGQLGSGVFKVRCQELAACTTAYGRKQLMFASEVILAVYGPGKDPRCDAEVIYGDTDSLFLRFRPKDPVTGVRLTGKAALQAAKDLTVEAGKLVTSYLKPPHDFEFDKIFRTFCLLSKKRYVGDMSEDGVEEGDFHRKSMGIVMKRRDNAPIVKYVYGGVIDRILDPSLTDRAKGVRDAAHFVKETVVALLSGKFSLHKLTITKSLRAEYNDPLRIAHKVLADRIAARDPGNKPSTSDRIPFVYIQTPAPTKLQGDRIETPTYIKAHRLKPDYAFYITNQIAKPVSQVFGLVVADLPGVTAAQVKKAETAKDPVAAKELLAEAWLFTSVLKEAARETGAMEAKGQRSIASFLSLV